MADDIRTLTARLAADPASLVFLDLAEALRRRGQTAAARKVVLAGLQRYPDLADAHDLLGRIHGDEREFDRAFEAWQEALRLAPGHPGALQGIGYLYFVAGDLDRAAEHLGRAAALRPDDAGIRAALDRVQAARAQAATVGAGPAPTTPVSAAPPATALPASAPARRTPGDGLVVADARGLRLGGLLRAPDGTDRADAAAAAMQGVAREADRAARMLGLGAWTGLTAEAMEGGLAIVPVDEGTVVMLLRGPEVPIARLGGLARRAAAEARAWLQEGA